MDSLNVSVADGIAEVSLQRGKVNALNEQVVEEFRDAFRSLAENAAVRAVILTGAGSFFSFGFDIPEFLDYSKESFTQFLSTFTDLYTYLFTYPKPLVAALNGHTIAGGCMIALTADYRIMVPGKAKISLNEITFGASVFAGSVAILTFLVGGRNAQRVLYEGAMFTAEQALPLGLVDQISAESQLMGDARIVARQLGDKDPAAFRGIKALLRSPVARETEKQSIHEFVDIWYSEETRSKLRGITIRA